MTDNWKEQNLFENMTEKIISKSLLKNTEDGKDNKLKRNLTHQNPQEITIIKNVRGELQRGGSNV